MSIENLEIKWRFDSGILHIVGAGIIETPDYTNWDWTKDQVTELHLGEGITEIPVRCFQNYPNLTKVILQKSLVHIHSKAFAACTKLSIVEAEKPFRHVYQPKTKEDVILFGMDAFRDVPWAREHFGEVLVEDGVVYCTFISEGDTLIVPEGVHTIRKLSMTDMKLETLRLPESLRRIENFAFARTSITNPVPLPQYADLQPYALADTGLIVWEVSESRHMEKLKRQLRAGEDIGKTRQPAFTNLYQVRSSEDFPGSTERVLTVRQRKQPRKRASIMNTSIDVVGESIVRRLKRGQTFLTVEISDNSIDSIGVFVAVDDDGLKSFTKQRAVPRRIRRDNGEEFVFDFGDMCWGLSESDVLAMVKDDAYCQLELNRGSSWYFDQVWLYIPKGRDTGCLRKIYNEIDAWLGAQEETHFCPKYSGWRK